MKKSLYSLMLSEEVMREIDTLAHKVGTNRSNLVNMILAEKVGMRTHEQHINDIFSGMEQLFASSHDLVFLFAPNTPRVTVRSNLNYKYHPGVRYEVELINGFVRGKPIGELTVLLRTQYRPLHELMAEFFSCLCGIEKKLLPFDIAYSYANGKFTRTIAYPMKKIGEGYTIDTDELSRAIKDYVCIVDKMMKACVEGASAAQLEEMYTEDLKKREVIL